MGPIKTDLILLVCSKHIDVMILLDYVAEPVDSDNTWTSQRRSVSDRGEIWQSQVTPVFQNGIQPVYKRVYCFDFCIHETVENKIQIYTYIFLNQILRKKISHLIVEPGPRQKQRITDENTNLTAILNADMRIFKNNKRVF